MNDMSCVDATATQGWDGLADELDRWGAAGRVAALWWRDDDAVAPTPQLARLVELAGDAPLALAVIPGAVEDRLAAALGGLSRVSVLTHGWRHVDHAGGGKSEYPPARAADEIAGELAAGRARLAALFGTRAAPVFVPPWNRFAEDFVPLLAAAGFAGLSMIAPRRYCTAHPGIAALDVDTDFVDWRGGGGFVGEARALGGIVAALRERRRDPAMAPAAAGILTHHLVLDAAGAGFLARLGRVVAAHPAARWVGVAELLR